MADYKDSDDEPEDERDQEQALLDEANKRYTHCVETEKKQRDRETAELRFQVPELQWDADAKRSREAGELPDGTPIPARPCLSVPKLDQPVQLVLNQQTAAHLGVHIAPKSPNATDDTAEIIQGNYRSMESDSQANNVRGWAFDRAVKVGRGFYRVKTKYDEEGGHPFDQVLILERIHQQSGVYLDPSAQQPDFSDGRYAFICTWMNKDEFCRKYPQSKAKGADKMVWASMEEERPEWVRDDDVLVVEYFHKETEGKTICLLEDGSVAEKDKLKKGAKVKATRVLEETSVLVDTLSGWDVLERGEWNGTLIPIVPEIGRELQPFDTERRYSGIIGPAMDAQKMYNYAASSAIELAALEPKAPWVMAEGQDDGYEEDWEQSNVRNIPYLKYKPKMLDEQLAPPPARAQVDVGRLGPSMQLLAQADQFIQSATATFDPSLGRFNQKERSGRAISALQEQADASSSHYLQNMANISMPYEAAVVLDAWPRIYDRPGRLVRVLDSEDKAEMVMLNQPYVVDPETKQPVAVEVALDKSGEPIRPFKLLKPPAFMLNQPPAPAAPAPVPPGDPSAPAGPMPPAAPPAPPPMPTVRYHPIRKNIRYAVTVSIGRSRQTLAQEAADEVGQILQAHPQLMTLIGPIYYKYRDFPAAKEIAEVLSKIRDKEFPDLEGDGEGMTLSQAQAMISGLQQQLQLLGAQMQAAMKALETDQAKQMAMLEKTRMDNETRLAITASNNETKLALEGIKASMDEKILALQHAFDTREHHEEMAHETGLAAAGGRTMQVSSDRGQETGEESTEESGQATLPPEPPSDVPLDSAQA